MHHRFEFKETKAPCCHGPMQE